MAESGGAWRRLRALLLRINAPLLAILALGVAFTAYYTSQMSDWLVMTDELLYVKLAQSISHTLSPVPTVHGEYFAVFNQLYPLLTAPVYALFDMPTAFKVIHVYNALIMGSAAIPAYLLTREVVSSRLAGYLVAALTVSVPWMAMSTMILTEVAAYPAFVWAILAMQRAVAQPSASRDLVAMGGILLAFMARTQFLLLGVALPVAIVTHELSCALHRRQGNSLGGAVVNGFRRSLREHRLLVALGGVTAAVAVALAVAGSLGKVLGNYETTAHSGKLLPSGWRGSLLVHVDFVVAAIGVLPFVLAAAWCLVTLARPSSVRAKAFASIAVVVVPALALEVTSFDLRFAFGGVQDRYLFYIVPLLFVGMVACLLDDRTPSIAVVAAGVAFAAMATAARYAPSGGPYFGSPASAFHAVFDGKAWRLGQLFSIRDLQPETVIAVGSVVLSVGAVVLMRRAPKRVALLSTCLALLAFCVVETRYVFGRMLAPSGRVVSGGPVKGRDWIDTVVGDNSSVGLLASPINYVTDNRGRLEFNPLFEGLWWSTEFWNDSVRRSYSYREDTTYTPFPPNRLTLNSKTGAVDMRNRVNYLVTAEGEIRIGLDGTAVRKASLGIGASSLALLKLKVPYRARWATSGIGADGWTSAGRAVVVRVFSAGSEAARRRVSLSIASTTDIRHRRHYEVVGPAGRLASGTLRQAELDHTTVSLCVPAHGFSDLKVNIAGRTKLPDNRLVGLRVVRILDARAPGRCAP